MNATPRPDPPPPTGPGMRWEAVPQPDWRLRSAGMRCRASAGFGNRACGAPAVAELERPNGAGHAWWAYCAQHLYGGWIEDGQVWNWYWVADEVAP